MISATFGLRVKAIERHLQHLRPGTVVDAEERIPLFRPTPLCRQTPIAAVLPFFPPRLLALRFGEGVIERLEPIPPPFFRATHDGRKGADLDMLLIQREACCLMRELPFWSRNAAGIRTRRCPVRVQPFAGFFTRCAHKFAPSFMAWGRARMSSCASCTASLA